jgi:hypothetical protein
MQDSSRLARLSASDVKATSPAVVCNVEVSKPTRSVETNKEGVMISAEELAHAFKSNVTERRNYKR